MTEDELNAAVLDRQAGHRLLCEPRDDRTLRVAAAALAEGEPR